MKRNRQKLYLIIVFSLVGLLLLFYSGNYFPQDLLDFENEMINAGDLQQQQLVVQKTIDFLMAQTIPADSIANIVRNALAKTGKTSASLDSLRIERLLDVQEMTDSLCARTEMVLATLLENIQRYKQKTASNEFAAIFSDALELAERIDNFKKNNYWSPLLQCLHRADEETFLNWQMAKMAFRLAGSYQTGAGKYELSKLVAIFGLKRITGIPDKRLYLDLCVRLQAAVWYDASAYLLAKAMGEWVIRECNRIGYHFRAVSQEYNIANQLILDRQNFRAIERLENVLSAINRWNFFKTDDWQWYYRVTLRGLAVAYKEIGETQKAIYYNSLFAEVASSKREMALHHKINAELAKDTAKFEIAEMECKKALEFVIIETPNGKKIADYFNSWAIYIALADLYLKYNLPRKAFACLEEWQELARDNPEFLRAPDRAAQHALYKAKALIRSADFDRANILLRYADENIQKINSPMIKSKYLLRAGEQYAAKHDYANAIRRLQKAREICRERNFYISEIESVLKLANIARNVDNVFSAGSLQTELEKIIEKIRDMGYKPLLIQALAEIIRENLRQQQYETAKNYSEQLLAEVAQIRDALQSKQRLVYFGHSTNHALKDAIMADIALRNKVQAFAKLNYSKGYALRNKLESHHFLNIDITELQSQFAADEAVVDYMVSQDTVYAFLLTNSHFELIAMPASKTQLQAEANRYLQLLSDQSPFLESLTEEEYRKLYATTIDCSHALYNRLFKKLEPFLNNAARVHIIPDGFLHSIPFGTLVAVKNKRNRFLIEDKAISYLPGAWMLVQMNQSKASTSNGNILVSVDPRLHESRELVQEMRRVISGNALNVRTSWNSKASLQYALEENNNVVLFLSHAEADWDDPIRSFIEFTLQDNETGQLYYADVGSLDLSKTNLVILAACETAGSRIYLGTGLSGLQRAFLTGGAGQVLATHWQVLSDFTAIGVKEFMSALMENENTTLALQKMQRNMILRLMNKHVYYKLPFPQIWGAYNLTCYKKGVIVPLATGFALKERSNR